MIGKNKRICHSCRRLGHYLLECPRKQRCPVCIEGFVKWMEVEKKTVNIGKLFFYCNSDYRFFKWSNVAPKKKIVMYEGESSCICSAKFVPKDDVEDISRMFKSLARIFEEKKVEISLNLTIHKGKTNAEENGKEKGH
ncbi:DNA-directed RNA polymerase 1B [Forsythia ovata]|uniref:DNA-directed RNA polymerase 1B n=1 Tax=Forsythia ovata TaxID=205694 RepID=A0ABD1RN06_9LAMI